MGKQHFSWLEALYTHKVATMKNYAHDLYGTEHSVAEPQKITVYERKVQNNLEYAKNMCGGWFSN